MSANVSRVDKSRNITEKAHKTTLPSPPVPERNRRKKEKKNKALVQVPYPPHSASPPDDYTLSAPTTVPAPGFSLIPFPVIPRPIPSPMPFPAELTWPFSGPGLHALTSIVPHAVDQRCEGLHLFELRPGLLALGGKIEGEEKGNKGK